MNDVVQDDDKDDDNDDDDDDAADSSHEPDHSNDVDDVEDNINPVNVPGLTSTITVPIIPESLSTTASTSIEPVLVAQSPNTNLQLSREALSGNKRMRSDIVDLVDESKSNIVTAIPNTSTTAPPTAATTTTSNTSIPLNIRRNRQQIRNEQLSIQLQTMSQQHNSNQCEQKTEQQQNDDVEMRRNDNSDEHESKEQYFSGKFVLCFLLVII